MKVRSIRDIHRVLKEEEIRFLDFRFTDLLGRWHHFSIPVEEYEDKIFEEGLGFDGSSIRGFQGIEESDMLVKPDLFSAFIDPFSKDKTLVFICNIVDPITRELYSRDPRNVTLKAEVFLARSGIADTAYFGPEAEFYIFDEVYYDQTYNQGYYFIDSEEGFWNAGKKGEGKERNLGYKVPYKEGYFPTSPMDSYQDLRSKMVSTLQKVGVEVEVHHHEVGTAGQAEIDVRFAPLLKMADIIMKYKYVIKNVALEYGKTVTFMPKPIFMDNGSGMHTHISLWKEGKNLFYTPEDTYANLSDIARYFIGGLLEHAHSVLAFTNPTTNSYKRLVPGYEAPVNLVYSQRNRSAAVRIPMYSPSPKAKRIEFRCPDPMANPYLAFPAILMAGIDGIIRQIEPPPPIDKNIYALPEEERKKIRSTPSSLREAIQALEKDHEFLLRGGVFTEDLIETWIQYKWDKEIQQVEIRPHPYEFALYYDG